MSEMSPRDKKEQIWVTFAANALPIAFSQTSVSSLPDARETARIAAGIADRMVDQWAARHGDVAFLLEGQYQCATCQKPLPEGADFTPSVDGVKFCNDACLKASGREE